MEESKVIEICGAKVTNIQGINIVNSSKHGTMFFDGTECIGNPELNDKLFLKDYSRIINTKGPFTEVVYIRSMDISSQRFLERLTRRPEIDYVLLPALFREVEQLRSIDNCYKLVCYIPTRDTSRLPNNLKVASSKLSRLVPPEDVP